MKGPIAGVASLINIADVSALVVTFKRKCTIGDTFLLL